jgi:hypothetical protein
MPLKYITDLRQAFAPTPSASPHHDFSTLMLSIELRSSLEVRFVMPRG